VRDRPRDPNLAFPGFPPTTASLTVSRAPLTAGCTYGIATRMNANTLFAGLAAVAVASAAAAQQLPRTPTPAFAALRATPPLPPPSEKAPPLVLSAAVVPASAEVIDDGPPVFNSEAAKAFASRIQPVLANACGGCHARKDHAGPFKMRYTSGEYVDHEATTANLHAAVRMIDRQKPAVSQLLTKALNAHGGAKDAPLRSRTMLAARRLEVWVHWAAARDGAGVPDVVPQVPAAAPVPAAGPPVNPPSVTQLTAGLLKERTPPAEEPPAPGRPTHVVLGAKEPGRLPPLPKAEPLAPGGFATGAREPTADPLTPNPADPFDPAAFNRAARPGKK